MGTIHSYILTVAFPWSVGGAMTASDNLALGKTTFQSSVFQAYHSSKAVDGDRNTDLHAKSCTHSLSEENPWWVVDLQQPKRIQHVVIVNRQHNEHSDRLHDFAVGVTNDHPLTVSPSPCNYTLCYFHKGPAGLNLNRTCAQEDTVGRFLIVQIYSSGTEGDYLTLCEVEIYGSPDENNNNARMGQKYIGGSPAHVVDKSGIEVMARSRVHCAMKCYTQKCQSLYYNEMKQSCLLYFMYCPGQLMEESQGWQFYTRK